MTEPMTEQDLAAYLQEMERQAVTYRSSELADEQAAALDFYEARPFGDEMEGCSQVVAPVVQEVVDYMTISVLRTFLSGDRVVEFEPKTEDGRDAAEDATEGVNQSFMHGQDGAKVLHDWLQTGLLEKICAVETTCVEEEKRDRRTITVSEEELAVLLETVEPIRLSEVEGGYQVTIETVRKTKRYVDMPIPNYEFLFSPRTRHEDESEYLCHRPKVTKSELVEMGFDKDKVYDLPANDELSDIDERESATWEDENYDVNDTIPGLQKVRLRKEYARIDYDGDGIAELLRVYRVGKVILEAEEVDEQPFTVFCPFPRSHRMVGNSLADKVMDIQRNKSVVMRQNFDGFYQTNRPRWWLPIESTGDTTIDDLLTPGPNVIVRGRGAAPVPMSQSFDVGRGIAMLDHLTGEQESRTGITRLNQGLDAEAMNKTATGMAMQQAQGQQFEEFVARQFASALSRLFMKKLRLMIEHGDPVAMRVDGQFKTADPSTWTDDVGVSIRVGLGSGKKEQRMAYRMQVAAMQQQAFEVGLVDKRRLYNTGAGFIRDANLGDPNDFFIDPDSQDNMQEGQEQEQPDPEMMKLQAEQQMQQAKMQAEQQLQQAKMQMAQQEAQMKLQLQREQAEQEADLAERKAQFEAQQAERKMQQEFELAQQRMQMEAQLASMKQADSQLSKNREGGSLAV